MSAEATFWAWSQDVTPLQKLVLLAIADRRELYYDALEPEYISLATNLTVVEVISILEELKTLGKLSALVHVK